jgi:O-antigen ligase
LWFGHGFGAVWTFDAFREQIRQLAGWPSQPLIGDNGLLDIFLHLGIVGVLLMIVLLVMAMLRSIHYAFRQRTLLGFFPLLILIYAFFSNITFSLLAETEVFVWLLIVVALFIPTPMSTNLTASNSG